MQRVRPMVLCWIVAENREALFVETMTWYPPPPPNASSSPMPSSFRKMAHLSRVRNARLLVSPQKAQEVWRTNSCVPEFSKAMVSNQSYEHRHSGAAWFLVRMFMFAWS